MPRRIGLYGGSFDPIHIGHLIVARAVAEQMSLDRVLMLPAAQPPHKSPDQLAPAEHRAEMVRLAVANEPLFAMDRWDLDRPGPAYTLDTVRHFREMLGPQTEFFWIIGSDSLRELPTWYRVAELVESCRIVTAARRESGPLDWDAFRPLLKDAQIRRLEESVLATPTIDVSATEIRARVRAGRSIRFLVPEVVGDYIHRTGLYGAKP